MTPEIARETVTIHISTITTITIIIATGTSPVEGKNKRKESLIRRGYRNVVRHDFIRGEERDEPGGKGRRCPTLKYTFILSEGGKYANTTAFVSTFCAR